jgi:competence protein ComEC
MGVCGACWQNPPHLLIDGQGKLVGLYEGRTLYVNSRRRGKFTAETWQQYLAAQEIKEFTCAEGVCRTAFKNIPILISHDQNNQPCEKGAVLVRLEPSKTACPESYLTIDWYDLWRRGGHALWFGAEGFHVKQVNTVQGHRPWTRRAIPRKERP